MIVAAARAPVYFFAKYSKKSSMLPLPRPRSSPEGLEGRSEPQWVGVVAGSGPLPQYIAWKMLRKGKVVWQQRWRWGGGCEHTLSGQADQELHDGPSLEVLEGRSEPQWVVGRKWWGR